MPLIPGAKAVKRTQPEEVIAKEPAYALTGNSREYFARQIAFIISALMIAYAVYLVFALYKTTVKDYDKYARAAANEQWTLMTYSANRGMIYDANMNALASNTYDYTVICSPSQVTSSTLSRAQIMQSVVSILGVKYEKIDLILPANIQKIIDIAGVLHSHDFSRKIAVR